MEECQGTSQSQCDLYENLIPQHVSIVLWVTMHLKLNFITSKIWCMAYPVLTINFAG